MLWTIDPAAKASLPDQIADCVRRGLVSGELRPGDRLPPAQELAAALGVDRNTVLAAYRSLRDQQVLEFRRGRGVRITDTPPGETPVHAAVRDLLALADRYGVDRTTLLHIIEELA